MRPVIGVLGAITALFPNHIIDVFEEVAISDSGDASTRSRFRSSIRVEGILITIACLLGGRLYAGMLNLTGLFGAVVVLFPDMYRKIATTLIYDQPHKIEWNDRFTPVVRLIGVVYILMAIRAFKKRQSKSIR